MSSAAMQIKHVIAGGENRPNADSFPEVLNRSSV